MVQQAQRAMILRRFEEIPGFEVVGAGTVRTIGIHLDVAQIHQRLADRGEVLLPTLNDKHLPITKFRSVEVS